MKLKRVFLEALVEQDPQGLDDYVEFPNQNFVVSIVRPQKKLIFSPQGRSFVTTKMRIVINSLKQKFNVLKVNSLEDEDDAGPGDTDDPKLIGVFEVVFDPREDFEAAVDFLKNEANK